MCSVVVFFFFIQKTEFCFYIFFGESQPEGVADYGYGEKKRAVSQHIQLLILKKKKIFLYFFIFSFYDLTALCHPIETIERELSSSLSLSLFIYNKEKCPTISHLLPSVCVCWAAVSNSAGLRCYKSE